MTATPNLDTLLARDDCPDEVREYETMTANKGSYGVPIGWTELDGFTKANAALEVLAGEWEKVRLNAEGWKRRHERMREIVVRLEGEAAALKLKPEAHHTAGNVELRAELRQLRAELRQRVGKTEGRL